MADRLRDRLAALHGVKRGNVLVTHGGDEGLRLAMTTFVDAGAAFGMAEPSYSLYPVLADIQGARTARLPLDEDFDLPRTFARDLNEAGATLACVVNPHAPSGRLMDTERVGRLASDFRGVLLLDEAYVDFVDPALRYDSVRLINGFDNLLILRTFSKGYSLAGLRLGYLIGSETLIEPLTKTRDSYNVDAISQVLGEAAVVDQAYAEDTWRQVRALRRTLRKELIGLGFEVPPSQANFLLAEAPPALGIPARDLYRGLKERGILVRFFDTPRLEDRLRISVGTAQQNERLIAALRQLLAG
jgi:histidinol-phosphate aminotransferase